MLLNNDKAAVIDNYERIIYQNFWIVSMFILIGKTMCPDELKRHAEYNNTSGINRKSAFGDTLCDHIYIFFQYSIEFNIQ